MPHHVEVAVDALCNPLGTGDKVYSTRKFDRAQLHVGVVTEVIGPNQITVKHRTKCCQVGRESESESALWKRYRKRPTAWEKLLRNDD